jgi:hypothetical protein
MQKEEKDEVPQYPLYHGMRSKKSADQIKREGFCAYGSPIDEKKNIIDALRYFGKEKLLTTEGRKGDRVRSAIREIREPERRVVWVTTSQDAVSLPLHQIDIEPEKIDKYLREKFGSNCYNVKLKMTARGQYTNFNTGINCIPSSFIVSIEKCKECKFTGKEHK